MDPETTFEGKQRLINWVLKSAKDYKNYRDSDKLSDLLVAYAYGKLPIEEPEGVFTQAQIRENFNDEAGITKVFEELNKICEFRTSDYHEAFTKFKDKMDLLSQKNEQEREELLTSKNGSIYSIGNDFDVDMVAYEHFVERENVKQQRLQDKRNRIREYMKIRAEQEFAEKNAEMVREQEKKRALDDYSVKTFRKKLLEEEKKFEQKYFSAMDPKEAERIKENHISTLSSYYSKYLIPKQYFIDRTRQIFNGLFNEPIPPFFAVEGLTKEKYIQDYDVDNDEKDPTVFKVKFNAKLNELQREKNEFLISSNNCFRLVSGAMNTNRTLADVIGKGLDAKAVIKEYRCESTVSDKDMIRLIRLENNSANEQKLVDAKAARMIKLRNAIFEKPIDDLEREGEELDRKIELMKTNGFNAKAEDYRAQIETIHGFRKEILELQSENESEENKSDPAKIQSNLESIAIKRTSIENLVASSSALKKDLDKNFNHINKNVVDLIAKNNKKIEEYEQRIKEAEEEKNFDEAISLREERNKLELSSIGSYILNEEHALSEMYHNLETARENVNKRAGEMNDAIKNFDEAEKTRVIELDEQIESAFVRNVFESPVVDFSGTQATDVDKVARYMNVKQQDILTADGKGVFAHAHDVMLNRLKARIAKENLNLPEEERINAGTARLPYDWLDGKNGVAQLLLDERLTEINQKAIIDHIVKDVANPINEKVEAARREVEIEKELNGKFVKGTPEREASDVRLNGKTTVLADFLRMQGEINADLTNKQNELRETQNNINDLERYRVMRTVMEEKGKVVRQKNLVEAAILLAAAKKKAESHGWFEKFYSFFLPKGATEYNRDQYAYDRMKAEFTNRRYTEQEINTLIEKADVVSTSPKIYAKPKREEEGLRLINEVAKARQKVAQMNDVRSEVENIDEAFMNYSEYIIKEDEYKTQERKIIKDEIVNNLVTDEFTNNLEIDLDDILDDEEEKLPDDKQNSNEKENVNDEKENDENEVLLNDDEQEIDLSGGGNLNINNVNNIVNEENDQPKGGDEFVDENNIIKNNNDVEEQEFEINTSVKKPAKNIVNEEENLLEFDENEKNYQMDDEHFYSIGKDLSEEELEIFNKDDDAPDQVNEDIGIIGMNEMDLDARLDKHLMNLAREEKYGDSLPDEPEFEFDDTKSKTSRLSRSSRMSRMSQMSRMSSASRSSQASSMSNMADIDGSKQKKVVDKDLKDKNAILHEKNGVVFTVRCDEFTKRANDGIKYALDNNGRIDRAVMSRALNDFAELVVLHNETQKSQYFKDALKTKQYNDYINGKTDFTKMKKPLVKFLRSNEYRGFQREAELIEWYKGVLAMAGVSRRTLDKLSTYKENVTEGTAKDVISEETIKREVKNCKYVFDKKISKIFSENPEEKATQLTQNILEQRKLANEELKARAQVNLSKEELADLYPNYAIIDNLDYELEKDEVKFVFDEFINSDHYIRMVAQARLRGDYEYNFAGVEEADVEKEIKAMEQEEYLQLIDDRSIFDGETLEDYVAKNSFNISEYKRKAKQELDDEPEEVDAQKVLKEREESERVKQELIEKYTKKAEEKYAKGDAIEEGVEEESEDEKEEDLDEDEKKEDEKEQNPEENEEKEDEKEVNQNEQQNDDNIDYEDEFIDARAHLFDADLLDKDFIPLSNLEKDVNGTQPEGEVKVSQKVEEKEIGIGGIEDPKKKDVQKE